MTTKVLKKNVVIPSENDLKPVVMPRKKRSVYTFVLDMATLVYQTWERVEISTRGTVSLARLEETITYSKTTSRLKIVIACLLTPLPALVCVLGIEFLQLQHPNDDWNGNWAFWMRAFWIAFPTSFGVALQIPPLLPDCDISFEGKAVMAVLTGLSYVAVYMVIAIVWRFPVPFGVVLLAGPYCFFVAVYFAAMVGFRRIVSTPSLRQAIHKQYLVIAIQGSLIIIYSSFGAVFEQASPENQIYLVGLLPLIKVLMKNIIALAGSYVEDSLPELIVFSVEIFNALFVATCLDRASSTMATIGMICSDATLSIFAVYQLRLKALTIQQTVFCGNTSRKASTLLAEITIIAQTKSFVKKAIAGSKIRVLSDIKRVRPSFGSSTHEDLSKPSSVKLFPSELASCTNSASESDRVWNRKDTNIDRSETSTNEKSIKRDSDTKPSSRSTNRDQRTQTNTHIDGQSESVVQRRGKTEVTDVQTELVEDTLQLLFQTEYLVLVEYVECIIPLLYLVYTNILYTLPNAVYYPRFEQMDVQQLWWTNFNITIYAILGALPFLLLHWTLKPMFGYSPIYLLSFVLENQAEEVQGRLLVWVIYVLQYTLVHFGVDFTFQFKYGA